MADIFLSYARKDRSRAQRLARLLEERGWSVWWDRRIPAGRSFEDVIEEAIDEARCVVVLWTEDAVGSDWVKSEAGEGRDRRVLVPVRLDDVRLPFAFRRLQTIELLDWDGDPEHAEVAALLTDVARVVGEPGSAGARGESSERSGSRRRSRRRGTGRSSSRAPAAPSRPSIPSLREEEAWVSLDGGVLLMGDRVHPDEQPMHRVQVPSFQITRFPVTNRQYAAMVAATGVDPPSHWDRPQAPDGLEDHPVVDVSWDDSRSFCRWLSGELGKEVALPSEAQWELAARGSGDDPRAYPWGPEEPSEERANFGDPSRGTTPVDSYPLGATPEGVCDLAGNVWEWCEDDWHRSYEGAPEDGSAWVDDPRGGGFRVVRGGAFNTYSELLRAAYRKKFPTRNRGSAHGFRVVRSSSAGP